MNAGADGIGSIAPPTAGARLLAAREAAGLSVDAVAQQLKLAPRQVKALEDGDYTHLPGRTFVRGFVRNYARLVHLDPDEVLEALPAGATAPALEAPTLQQTAPTIGELPTTDHSRPGWARWAIPATLAAIVAAAAMYEWSRPAGVAPPTGPRNAAVVAERRVPAPAAAPDKALAPAPAVPPAATGDSGTRLPNPLAATAPASDASLSAAAAGSTAPGSTAPASPAPGPSAPVAGEQPLMLAFRDYSWTEVRDRDGRVLLSRMNPGGTAQTVSGTPPLEVVIGNAADVSLSYRGQPVDLVPYTRQNVARLTLP